MESIHKNSENQFGHLQEEETDKQFLSVPSQHYITQIFELEQKISHLEEILEQKSSVPLPARPSLVEKQERLQELKLDLLYTQYTNSVYEQKTLEIFNFKKTKPLEQEILELEKHYRQVLESNEEILKEKSYIRSTVLPQLEQSMKSSEQARKKLEAEIDNAKEHNENSMKTSSKSLFTKVPKSYVPRARDFCPTLSKLKQSKLYIPKRRVS